MSGLMPVGPWLGASGILLMLLLMFVTRIPASFAMAVVGFLGLVISTSLSSALHLMGTEFWTLFSNYGYTVIPMFILVGEIVYYAGYSDQLYHATDRWFGHVRGGVAVSTIVACGGFSAICGSNTATAATMGAIAMPAMKRYGYHPVLSAGAIGAGSTLGVMIPPSIVLVVYGLYTSQSIGKLFFGTIIPGITLMVLMAVTVVLICIRHPDWGPRGEKASWKERFSTLPGVLDVCVIFAAIMVAMYAGFVTATEAASVSAFLALVICVVRRKLTWEKLRLAIRDTLHISCVVFMIVAGAAVFGRFMAVTRLPYVVAESIGAMQCKPWIIVAAMLLVYAIGGCIMDALAFLLISMPIFSEVARQLNFDMIWFGEILCVVTTLGAITPPVGICCFIISGMHRDIRLTQVFKGALYFMPAYIVTIILMILFPDFMVGLLASQAR